MLELLAQDSQGGSSLVAFLPLLLMGGVFYFLLIRPQQRRARAQQALLRSVEVGDEIVTTAGVFGTIVAIDDESDVITLEIAPGTRIRMVRAGVGRIVGDEPDAIESDDVDTEVPDGRDGPFQQT
jgi:preprotein translocase subunit YajC